MEPDGYVWNLNTGLKYLDSAWLILRRQTASSSRQVTGENVLTRPFCWVKTSYVSLNFIGLKHNERRLCLLPFSNKLFHYLCDLLFKNTCCILAEMRKGNKSATLTKQSLFSWWCLNRRLKTKELHLFQQWWYQSLVLTALIAYTHMFGCGNSWGNRLTNNDSRRECSPCSVAFNHNDFDTTGSRVLQATMTTVVSCMVKAKSNVFC